MVSVTVLSKGFDGYKSRSVLLPLIEFRSEIEERGIDLSLELSLPRNRIDASIVIVEDRFLESASTQKDPLSQLKEMKGDVDKLLWLDTSDSSGTLDEEVVPLVDGYYKKQLLENRKRYLEPIRGERPYTAPYYEDAESCTDIPDTSPLANIEERDLSKLGVFWNIGLDIQFPGLGTVFASLPFGIAISLPWYKMSGLSVLWPPTDKSRPNNLTGRFRIEYDNDAIEAHRRKMKRIAGRHYRNERIGKFEYWRELRKSKVVLSPFGWGEICRRDFEGFLNGCLVLKPSMEHLATWPPLYEEGETYLPVQWDMSDMKEKIQIALDDWDTVREVAETGQNRYRDFTVEEQASTRFAEHFINIIEAQ